MQYKKSRTSTSPALPDLKSNRRKQMHIIVKGRKIKIDPDTGYLKNLGDWNEHVANALARKDGLDQLTPAHWEIITFLRSYYEKYGLSPLVKILTLEVRKTFGPEKGNTKYLYDLFPQGPSASGCRIAGIPKAVG